MIHDLRLALRTLARSPGFAFVAIASLALGIGANSTIFSLVRGTLFPTLPYRDVGRLVDLYETSAELCAGCGVGTSYETFRDWQVGARAFSIMGASREDQFVVSGVDEAVRVPGALVSATLFPTLGVQPVVGRGFAADEDKPGGARVVLLSHRLWDRMFGADSGVVGRSVRVNGVPATVVGVMPMGFGYPEFAQMWTPMGAVAPTGDRGDRSTDVVARLAPGVTIEQARADLKAVGEQVARENAAQYEGWSTVASPILDALRDDSGPPFLILLGASAFVLLIACANLANLMLVRASRREREVAVRLALGAGRARLVQMLLAESVLVSMAGGSLGLLLALWGVDLVPQLIGTEIPFWIVFAVDWRVVLFALLVSCLTAVAFGFVPALRASRPNLVDSLKAGGQSTTSAGRRSRLRSILVVAQIACALVLLAGAGLMIKTFVRARNITDLGYDPRGVITASVHLMQPRYEDAAQVGAFVGAVQERLAAVPGVSAASVEHSEFLGTFVGALGNMTLEGSATAVPDNLVPRFSRSVGTDYFQVLRMPLRRGRVFDARDRAGAPGVVVVSEAAAQVLWPNADPIGKRLKLGAPESDRPWLTVVGVVASAVGSPLGRSRPTGFVYVPFAQQPGRPISVLARTAGDPATLGAALRAEVRAVDADAAVDAVTTMEASLASWIGPVRFFVRLLGALATLAVGLAALGIYGVMSYAVAQRTREIGIRMALGASSRGILRLVVAYGVGLTIVGVLIGIAGSFALTGALRGMLFGTSPTDPLVFAAVSVLLALVAVAACYAPAKRAVRIEPIIALRHD